MVFEIAKNMQLGWFGNRLFSDGFLLAFNSPNIPKESKITSNSSLPPDEILP